MHPTLRAAREPKISWMLPKEHGAYVQLGVPLLAAVFLAGGGLAAWAVTLGATFLFLAHEPLLILLGQRGARVLERDGAAARAALAVRAGVGGVALLAALPAMGARGAESFAIPGALGTCLLLLVRTRREKSALGEVLAPFALCAWGIPVMAAGGAALPRATAVAFIFAVSFAAPVLAMRAVIFGNRPRAPKHPIQAKALLGISVCAALGIAVARLAGFGLLGALAPMPVVAASVLYAVVLPSPRLLKKLGWSMATASLAMPVMLGWAAR